MLYFNPLDFNIRYSIRCYSNVYPYNLTYASVLYCDIICSNMLDDVIIK